MAFESVGASPGPAEDFAQWFTAINPGAATPTLGESSFGMSDGYFGQPNHEYPLALSQLIRQVAGEMTSVSSIVAAEAGAHYLTGVTQDRMAAPCAGYIPQLPVTEFYEP